MKKKFIYIAGVLIFLTTILSIYFVYKPDKTLPAEVHYHAGFVVFDNGQKVDFSGSKYMYIKPCSVNQSQNLTVAEQQLEKAHLHDGVGDVIHIEAAGAKWKDLFTNIGFSVNYASVSGYVNGNLVPDFQDTPINPYDSLVLFIGPVDKNLLSQAVTKDRILQVEKTSVGCGE